MSMLTRKRRSNSVEGKAVPFPFQFLYSGNSRHTTQVSGYDGCTVNACSVNYKLVKGRKRKGSAGAD